MNKVRLFGGKYADLTLQSPKDFGDVVVVGGVLYQKDNQNRSDSEAYYAYIEVKK